MINWEIELDRHIHSYKNTTREEMISEWKEIAEEIGENTKGINRMTKRQAFDRITQYIKKKMEESNKWTVNLR